MLLVGGGVALASAGLTDISGGMFVAVVRIGTGVLVVLAGVLLVRRQFRAAGIVIAVMGVLFLGVAMVFAAGADGGALLMALVFGSLGLTGVILGSAVALRPSSIREMSAAVGRPVASCLSVLYLLLGVVAVHDGRIVLAVADITTAIFVAAVAVASLLNNGVDGRWSVCALGVPCIVDGVETAAHGKALSGTVSVAVGVFLLAALAVRLSGRAVTLWRYATMAPTDSVTVPLTGSRETTSARGGRRR